MPIYFTAKKSWHKGEVSGRSHKAEVHESIDFLGGLIVVEVDKLGGLNREKSTFVFLIMSS